ncbi:flagellar basal body-associated FliL family protein [Motiliproteus sp. SC1-56]|uniref:flagellar basal body-associated FliL family protein n=1 Tax=Motiliproteus sp. SC1-56 TaxID=2799565 RepID=UPI001A8D7E5C|nr:flagellar basal body-associated FliL family protein [Motiliproteus sp. SC1-56]
MAEDTAQAGAGKKSNKLIIILVVLTVVLVGALAAGAAWYLLAGDSDSDAAMEAAPASSKSEAIYVKLRTLGGKPSFVANFYERSGRQRFMQIYAEARTRDPLVAEALKKHMPLVVHTLSTLFSNQSFSDMQSDAGKRRLRQQATLKVQEILQNEIGTPGIDEVFFTNFVMQ